MNRKHQGQQRNREREKGEKSALQSRPNARSSVGRDPNEPFTGSLMTKTKPTFKTSHRPLGLRLTIDGGKKDLLARINGYFNENPLLCEDPRFEGIFNRSHRPAAQNDENHPPTSTVSAGARLSTLPMAQYVGVAPLTTNVINTLPLSMTAPSTFASSWPIHS